MQWIAKICIDRSVFTWVMMLTVCVVGAGAYVTLGLDQFPNIDIPVVTVISRLDGYAPQEVETDITDKLENNLNTISGIEDMRSISSDGVSQVTIMFQLEKDGDVAAQDVRDKVSNATRDLPQNIDPPSVIKLDPGAVPVMYLTVSSAGTIRDTTELADKTIKRALQGVYGVGQVSLVGGRKREMRIWLDPMRLNAVGLTAQDVQMAMRRQNVSTPGGNLEGGAQERGLRIEGRVSQTADLGSIVVRQNGDHPLRVRDVARVEDGSEDEASWASLNGTQSVLLSVRKQSGENTVALVDRLKVKVAELQTQLPQGSSVKIVRDNSEVIRTSVDAVIEHLILGAVFAIVVVLIFLGSVKSTLVAALAIPISIVGTFALMWYQGFTLNILTLLALALSVGIVIDDAIVVLENIHRFVHEKGMNAFDAAKAATQDIGLAVIATTLSLMAVFLPIAFMGGVVGRFLRSFGMTMAFAVGVSMLVSFTLTPMLCARWIDARESDTKNSLERLVDRFYSPIESIYMVLLRWAMGHRGIVMILCVGTLASCYPLSKFLSGSFLPPNDEGQLEMHVRAPEGTSLIETRLLVERIASEARATAGVDYSVVTIGDDQQELRNKGTIYLRLTDPKTRSATQQDIANVLRNTVVARQDKGLRIDVSDVTAFGGESSATIQYTISGPDLDRLKAVTQDATARLKNVPGAVDVDSNLVDGKPEVQVHIERDRAADLGITAGDVSETLQLLVAGLKVSTFAENGESFDVRLRAEAQYRADAYGLQYFQVPRAQGGVVPLSEVVSIQEGSGPAQINRLNRRRQVTIFANAAPGFGQNQVLQALEQIIDDAHLPPAYSRSLQGQSREMAKTGRGFAIAFAASFVFMYLVLAAQFESWVHPFTILCTLPLTVPFALLSLIITHQPLSMFSALGLLVLFGVVKKNAILQVDHTNTLRAHGLPREEAILEANKDRLRPILMTTIAFVAGMLPLIFSKGIGAGNNQATAGVVVGGQSLSLLLTLLATPVIYSLLDDLGQKLARFRAPS